VESRLQGKGAIALWLTCVALALLDPTRALAEAANPACLQPILLPGQEAAIEKMVTPAQLPPKDANDVAALFLSGASTFYEANFTEALAILRRVEVKAPRGGHGGQRSRAPWHVKREVESQRGAEFFSR